MVIKITTLTCALLVSHACPQSTVLIIRNWVIYNTSYSTYYLPYTKVYIAHSYDIIEQPAIMATGKKKQLNKKTDQPKMYTYVIVRVNVIYLLYLGMTTATF